MFTNTFLRELRRCCSWVRVSRRHRSREHPIYQDCKPSRSSTSQKLQQHLLAKPSVPFIPLKRRQQANASSSQNGRCDSSPPMPHSGPPHHSAPPQCPAQDLMCTTCAIAISSDSDNPVFHMRIHRQLTPPHIAEGKGHSHDFDKYILL